MHGGDVDAAGMEAGRDPEALLDFSANLHPLGPAPRVIDAAVAAVRRAAGRYPPPHAEPLRVALEERLGAHVVVGNGATELLHAALAGMPRTWLRAPSYAGYAEAAGAGSSFDRPAMEPGHAIVIGRPNNPDGNLPDAAAVCDAARRNPGVRWIVDESFLAFTDAPSCLDAEPPPNLLVVTSMTKTHAIPGLRLGWAAGHLAPSLKLPPWSVNAAALAAGLAALDEDAHVTQARELLQEWRPALADALRGLPGVAEVRGAANFLLVRLDTPDAAQVRNHCLHGAGVLVRDASDLAGLDGHYIRVAVRRPEENARLLSALGGALRERS